jgi:hypothetical protein
VGEKAGVIEKESESKEENPVLKKRRPDFYQDLNSPFQNIFFLQRAIGNQAVQRLFKSGPIQAKLKISQPTAPSRAVPGRFPETGIDQAPSPEKEPAREDLGKSLTATPPSKGEESIAEKKGVAAPGKEPKKKGEERAVGPEEGMAKEGGEKEAALAGTEAVSMTPEDPGQVLEQLENVQPTSAIGAYEQAQKASLVALAKQKQQVEQSLPAIPAPTGLPAKGSGRKEKGKAAFAEEKAPASFEGEKSGQEGEEYETKAEEAPPPPPVTPTILSGSEDKESGEGDAELSRSAQNSLESVQLSTTQISTNAGERPAVEMTGEADPSQMDSFESESSTKVQMGKAKASQEIYQDFGENDIFPEPTRETLKARKALASPKSPSGKGGGGLSIPAEAVGGLNRSLGPILRERVGKQKERYDGGQEKFESDSADARADADKQIADLKNETRQKQIEEQGKAKAEVAQSRAEWQAELDGVEQDYKKKAGKATEEQKDKILKEKQKGEKEATKHLDEAEKKAEKKKQETEKEAHNKKQEAKKESKGFWGWVKSKASALINGLKKAVNFLYDNLRKAVKLIFEVAKKLVKAAIDLARRAIVGLIKGFGIILKGLVTIVFAAFPNIRRKINSKIDKAVNTAVKGVNKAAEYLQKGVEAVLDFLANTLDKILGFIQSLYNGIFTVIGMIIRGEFKELMERIGSLVDAAKGMPSHLEGAVWEQLIGIDISKPMPGEAGYEPAQGAPKESEERGGLEGSLTEEDILAEPVATDLFDPELMEDLNLPEGEERVLGERSGDAYSLAAVLEDFPQAEAGIASTATREPSVESELGPTRTTGPTMGRAERAAKVWDQIKKFMGDWLKANWGKLLLAVIGALVGLIAATILTGGAILAALPIIMKIVAAIFIGVAIMKAMDYLRTYLSEGWEKRILAAAKALAGAIAVGIVELAMALGFRVIGAGLKAVGKGVKTGAKIAVTGVKRAATTTVAAFKSLLKSGARLVSKSGSALIRGGKLIFKGLERGFSKGIKKAKDLTNWLFKKFRVKKFTIQISGQWIEIWAHINPKFLISRTARKLLKELDKSTVAEVKSVAATQKKFPYKLGAIMEKIATKATKAKEVVDTVVSKLAAMKPGVYGKPDNIKMTTRGLISEVEEVKFFGRETLEDLGALARKNPKAFVEEGLGTGKFIQIGKHVETMDAIALNPTLVQGTVVKGVSKNVNFIVTLPKFVGEDLKAVKAAVADMKTAWASQLGVKVTVRFGSHTPSEVVSIAKGIKVVP